MQRLSADPEPTAAPSPGADDAVPATDVGCPVCGEPVRGIATARPGEHRFVGCDHYASARFLRSYAGTASPGAERLRIGP